MGAHKGWRVKMRQGFVLGMVRENGRYRTKSFDSASKARDWAKNEAARLLAGMKPEQPGVANVETLAKDYLASLGARGRSLSHRRNVKKTLAGMQVAAPNLAAPHAGAYIERWLDKAQGSPSTRNRRLVEVRAFVRWAMRHDRLEKDPTRAIERSSANGKMRAQFSINELVSMLAMPTPDPCLHRRAALMILAGLRADEAAALRWTDINMDDGVILVRKREGYRLKRDKERIVSLQPLLRSLLGAPGDPAEQVAPLGLFQHGPKGKWRRYRDSNARKLLPAYLSACGIPVDGRTAHSCRHGYAGLMTATGVPGPLLSAYLGHTSAATTMIYTKLAARYAQVVQDWPRGELRLAP